MEKKQFKILVAEDDEDDVLIIEELIRDGLKNYHPSVHHVDSYDAALSSIEEGDFSICLFDYRLGAVNGIDLLKDVRGKGVTTPIIFLTGQGDQEIAVEAMKAGATDYLVKGNLTEKNLSQSIRYAVNLHVNEEERKRAAELLLKQERLLQGVSEATNRLLTVSDRISAIKEALAVLGKAAVVDRVHVFEDCYYPDLEERAFKHRFEWVKEDIEPQIDNPNLKSVSYQACSMSEWYNTLIKGKTVCSLIKDLPAKASWQLEPLKAMSLILVPIIIENYYWGFIGFFDCRVERQWSRDEEAILKVVAASIGGAIKQQRDEDAFLMIVEGTSSRTGDDFFRSLTHHLASALRVRYALVSEFTSAPEAMGRSIACWMEDTFVPNFEYSVANTPYEELLAGMMTYYPDDVKMIFPNDVTLSKMKAKSFAGVPFFDSSLKVIGHLAVLDDKPILDKQRTISILRIFAARAGAELERKRAEITIKNMAYYDSLTGLPNRILLNDRLTLAMAHAYRNKQMLATMFLDLDNFKPINDTLGHVMGDKILIAVGQRLKSCLRDIDTVARLGGDEFIVLLPQIHRPDDVDRAAKKILDSFNTPFEIDGEKIHTTTSIGIALYPNDGDKPEELLKKADDALYRAKSMGKNTRQLFHPVP